MISKRILTQITVVLFVAATVLPSTVFAADIDTDGDGIPNIKEDLNGNNVIDPGETDPLNVDTDRGGESDGSEITAERNPLDPKDDLTADPDGDGWVNSVEIANGTDPLKADSDGDGVSDSEDAFPIDNKYSEDANANGLPDEWEKSVNQNEKSLDPNDDTDKDGLSNKQEFYFSTNPYENDTDRDGLTDKIETDVGNNPRESACLQFSDPSGILFSDTVDHWSKKYVGRLQGISLAPSNTPLLRGRRNGDTAKFEPDSPITRFELLKLLILGNCTQLPMDTLDPVVQFTDVPSIPQQNESQDAALRRKVVYAAVKYGIVSGYPDGTFRPDALVNRAEAMKILSLAAQLPVTEDSEQIEISFSDVANTDWFLFPLRLAVYHGILTGYDDGTFRPTQPITRAEAAKIVYLALRNNPFINGYVLPDFTNEE